MRKPNEATLPNLHDGPRVADRLLTIDGANHLSAVLAELVHAAGYDTATALSAARVRHA